MTEKHNINIAQNSQEFRVWLEEHYNTESECYLSLKRGKPQNNNMFYYIDAVEVALCFGWIDSTVTFDKGLTLQRFSPRSKKSPWTELNKERVRRLERLGLMTDSGRRVLPPMGPRSFKIDDDIVKALKEQRVWSKFKAFPPLYQRVRAYNVAFYKKLNYDSYKQALNNLIKHTQLGEMYGEWNDYGRLL